MNAAQLTTRDTELAHAIHAPAASAGTTTAHTTTGTVTPLRREVRAPTSKDPLLRDRGVLRRLSRAGFAVLSRLDRTLAVDLLHRAYFTPARQRPTARQAALLAEADRSTLEVGGQSVVVYRWREPDYPWEAKPKESVLLVHGWSGSAAQMTPFVRPLREAGFAVTAFDWPAHGTAAGRTTTVLDAARVVAALHERFEPCRAVVAHSLGAAAVMLALGASDDAALAARALVFLAPVSRLDLYPCRFATAFGASDAAAGALLARITETFGEALLQPGLLARHSAAPALLVHDVDDAESPYTASRELAAAWPSARLLTSAGLGHVRLLADTPVIEEVTAFISSSAR